MEETDGRKREMRDARRGMDGDGREGKRRGRGRGREKSGQKRKEDQVC
jgi:hypothetical protein